MSVPQVRETLVPGKPEVACFVPRDGIHFFAGYAMYGNKPAVLEIGQSMPRKHPDAPTIILIQGLHDIVRQSISLTEDCGLSILPSGQTIASGDPDAPIRRRDHGVDVSLDKPCSRKS